MAENQEKLKQRRGGHKSVITRQLGDLDIQLQMMQRTELKARSDSIKTQLNKIDRLNDKICDGLTGDELNTELESCATYEETVNKSLARIQMALETMDKTKGTSSAYKLPKLTLPTYSGDYTLWTSFVDVFESMIGNNSELTPVQKFTYLQGQLQGEAAELIKGFKVQNDSYEPAMELLKKTYGQPEKIKTAFVQKLVDLVPPEYEVEDLKQYYATFESTVRTLRGLKTTADELMAIILLTKVPSPLKGVIKRELKEGVIELNQFIEQFQLEVYNMDQREEGKSGGGATASFVTPVVELKGDTTGPTGCRLCSGDHMWYKCPKYPSNEQKIKRAKTIKRCTSCMGDHGGGRCKRTDLRDCKHCKGKHFYMLCPKTKETKTSTTATCQVSASNKRTTVLPTMGLPLEGNQGGTKRLRALIDQCSQRTFILRSVLKTVKYKRCEPEQLKLQGFTRTAEPKDYEVVQVSYKCRGKQRSMKAVVVDKLPRHHVEGVLNPQVKSLISKGLKLADTWLQGKGEVHLLVGADYYYDLVHPGFRREGDLILIPTIRGYMLSGTFQQKKGENTEVDVVTILRVAVHPTEKYVNPSAESTQEISDLDSLWNLDNIGIVSGDLDRGSKQVLEKFDQTITYDESEQRYEVSLPWNERKSLLQTNFGTAMGRLRGLQRRFALDEKYKKMYSQVIVEQEERGFIEEVPSDESEGQTVHYLSHHGVKKESPTTPIRIVFDCSAKAPNGLSLNDCLESGPSLVPDLVGVLLRFRINKFAWISDIEKAFLMVKLKEEDRDAVRFLWPVEIDNLKSPCKIYRFRVVLFGATCSQFLLNATILHHLDAMGLDCETGAKIREGLYIDNMQGTGNSESDLLQDYHLIKDLFDQAGLGLREWATNSPLLHQQVTNDGVAAEQSEEMRVLGLKWSIESDRIGFPPVMVDSKLHTKRQCLSLVAHQFDPLGLLLPVTIKGRMGLQDLWRAKVDWDEEIPQSNMQFWEGLLLDYKNCSKVSVPRSVTTADTVELHCFSDASTMAYGTVVYLVSEGKCTLLISKGKVAPIKPVTVPKLELTAVLLSARLLKFVLNNMCRGLKVMDQVIWCDSQIALHWLTNAKPKPLYVTHRVDEIKELAPGAQIRYIKTAENPADLITRGLTASQLQFSSLWWEGPQWITVKEQWPEEEQFGELTEPCATLIVREEVPVESIIKWTRFGSYQKAVNVVAWLKRFITNLKKATQGEVKQLSPVLTLRELRGAEMLLVELLQKEAYPIESRLLRSKTREAPTNTMRQLGLYLHDNLIKCRGRLQFSDLKELTKNPILLPNKHYLTKLLIRRCHELSSHSGVNYVIAFMRQRWWIPKMRQAVKRVHHQCKKCKRLQGKPYTTPTNPSLPELRVKPTEPFNCTGVDYTGAMNVKTRVGRDKAYVVLFTCAATRAVHLEVVNNLSSDSFIHAFRRFISRRGYPQLMLSDNATNFMGAANYLKEIQSDPKVISVLKGKGCEWRFIPARAPWFGAIWERLIGVIKAGMRKVLARALVTIEELTTVVNELEAMVNDRPLTYVSGDREEPEPVTPSMLLYGRRLVPYPHLVDQQQDLEDATYGQQTDDMKVRLEYVTKVSGHLWQRWSNEYLTFLRTKVPFKTAGSWPMRGDVVLVQDEGPRLQWKLARVLEPIKGHDGIIRVARIMLSGNVTTRPIVKLYPVERDVEVLTGSGPELSDGHEQQVGGLSRPQRKAAQKSTEGWRTAIRDGNL